MQNLTQTIINGLLLGGLYAVVGVGMSMIFGIVRLTNLAHGDFLILASYLGFIFATAFGWPPLLTLVLVVPIMFALGFVIQNSMLNKVISKGDEAPLLVTFGLSIVIQNLLLWLFTPDARILRSTIALKSVNITDSIKIPLIFIVNFAISVVIIFLLAAYLKKTYGGQAIRAASDDRSAAQLMGVNIKRIYGLAMGIAMITASVAGVLVGMTYNFYPNTGTQYLIVAFGVVVIGGMGSITGTFFAGLIFGLAQLLGAHFFGTGLQLLAGYFVLLAMLIFRPKGLFSKI